MRWLPYALACSIFLASADFFIKLASNKISASMGMFIYGATTFTIGLFWVGYLILMHQPLLITQTGLLYSIAVGVAFSSVTILLYLTFARVGVSLGSPTSGWKNTIPFIHTRLYRVRRRANLQLNKIPDIVYLSLVYKMGT